MEPEAVAQTDPIRLTRTPPTSLVPLGQRNRERPASITADELPLWVPGDVVSDSAELGWKGVAQRTWRYRGQDVEIPPMACYMIVHYRQGQTPMDRQFDGRWTRTVCEPGVFSLLSSASDSHWHWTEDLEVSHLYLTDELMCRVASDVLGRDVTGVRLHDVLRGTDPVIDHIAAELTREAREQRTGSALYAEALSTQLAVHLLRDYASCRLRAPGGACRLTEHELRRLEDYVDANLHTTITLEDMARTLGMGAWTLNRHLRRTLGVSAYAFVVDRRIHRARQLLGSGGLALKELAAAAGFSDQAHMTRLFRARLGATPGQVRGQG